MSTETRVLGILQELEQATVLAERTRILTALEETIRVFTMLEKDPDDDFTRGALYGLHTAIDLITGEDE